MGVTNSNKQISTELIDCDGSLNVTLSLTAVPDISDNPADIVLVLDRSGSMEGSALENLKIGANTFIDIIDETTDGSQDGQIGGGSHIAIVSFSSTATVDEPLITSVEALKDAVDALVANGFTNHADAFTKAGELFDPASTAQKIIVMFTDGKTTAGIPPAPVAAALRAAGIVIYCIGLIGTDGIDVDTLNDWATDPDSEHVAVTPDEEKLEELFAELAASISKPGATNIVINEVINPDFIITSLSSPSKGTATLIGTNTIRWTIPTLGSTASETATLEFTIQHIALTSGVKQVNASISYTDDEGNDVTFPDPAVDVECGIVITPEPCPEPIDICADGCQDSLVIDLGDTSLESVGRIIQVSTTIRDVCPNTRVALAVILTELDRFGVEHQRGLKTITVPAHDFPSCRDVEVRCIKFVLPDDLNVSCDEPVRMCCPRRLRVRLISHPIDSSFRCCDSESVDFQTPCQICCDTSR